MCNHACDLQEVCTQRIVTSTQHISSGIFQADRGRRSKEERIGVSQVELERHAKAQDGARQFQRRPLVTQCSDGVGGAEPGSQHLWGPGKKYYFYFGLEGG